MGSGDGCGVWDAVASTGCGAQPDLMFAGAVLDEGRNLAKADLLEATIFRRVKIVFAPRAEPFDFAKEAALLGRYPPLFSERLRASSYAIVDLAEIDEGALGDHANAPRLAAHLAAIAFLADAALRSYKEAEYFKISSLDI